MLGVYAEQNNQGQRLTTLHSGASVETLSVNGEFTQVRLGDGTTGWVKTTYLTTREPATVRVKQLEEELDRSRATTPALAEAAARSEVRAAASASSRASNPNSMPHAQARGAAGSRSGRRATAPRRRRPAPMAGIRRPQRSHRWMAVSPLLAALACGFWLGYATLARRIKHKFGGIKVY